MKRSLVDILQQGTRDSLAQAWDQTEAADDFAPLPAGDYVCRAVSGELFTSKTNQTPGYKVTFRVLEGEHAGRQCWLDLWLTPSALPFAKRDLAKLGVCSLEQLERPLPQGMRCAVRVAIRRDDDGNQRNAVRRFEVIGTDPPDPFAPDATDPTADGSAERRSDAF